MTVLRQSRSVKHRLQFFLVAPMLAGCSRAPSVDILGSFFPAWLICLVVAIVLTVFVQLALKHLHMQIALPALVYPSLTALFTFALWFIFFY